MYTIDISNVKDKQIFDLGENFSGVNPAGEKLSFTNYYMCKNEKPYFGVSGEFHFSRMQSHRWEDEIIKMKMCGINTIATYVFWIHHEEEEGVFDFSGRRNLREFVELCKKHALNVILRIGPFAHGECRNGGLPDWLYGKPFEVRHSNPGFMAYVKRLYERIGEETKGLYFKDGGPIIAVQIDNEYMHSSAPWEHTNGISNEWVFGGNEGEDYMLKLQALSEECGIEPVFNTCTAWGGAITPENMMPLWGGYSYRPWLFYSYRGEHPATEEYIYQNFHNNEVITTNDFRPAYKPEEKPYACCEMGGGMMCTYNYRFALDYKSVDAMANIKLASGCNFLGYYVFQGGSNPVGKLGGFLNEGQVAKITYDYQAPLGEFGQIRESYRRLKVLHYFVEAFGKEFCELQTILPEGASKIEPTDLETLRYAIRTDGVRGYLFINNFQDHRNTPDKRDVTIRMQTKQGEISFETISLAGDENCILPFYMDMDGITLVQATAQPVTVLKTGDISTYVFMQPKGMQAGFSFEAETRVNGTNDRLYEMPEHTDWDMFTVEKGNRKIQILCISRAMADTMYSWKNRGIIFSEEPVLIDKEHIRLETIHNENTIYTYPANLLRTPIDKKIGGNIGVYAYSHPKADIKPTVEKVSENRYTIAFPKRMLQDVKDARLSIGYRGDIGHAFFHGKLIHDNFCNGQPWEIGLKDFVKEIEEEAMTVYITPKKEGVTVNVESGMAARFEVVEDAIGEIDTCTVTPVYEIQLI